MASTENSAAPCPAGSGKSSRPGKGNRAHDLRGRRFGKLVALRDTDERRHGKVVWLCVCDCGGEKRASSDKLLRGKTTSCGCLRRKAPHPPAPRKDPKHGLTGTPVYYTYHSMRARCCNPKSRSYKNYGGRGITICERWRGADGFLHFVEDMGLPPGAGYSIERDDTNGGYTPGNCRWLPLSEQSRNRRNNHWVEYEGKRQLLADLARARHIPHRKLLYRVVTAGWPIERALDPARGKPGPPKGTPRKPREDGKGRD